MVTREEVEKIAFKDNERRLNISRVPIKTKNLFTQLANEEFAGDYGLLLKYILEQSLEYQSMKSTFMDNINMKLDLLLESKSEKDEKVITTFSGIEMKRRKE